MTKLIKWLAFTIAITLFAAVFPAAVSAQASDPTPGSEQFESDNPEGGYYSPGPVAVTTEDVAINQLNEWTTILEQTDASSADELEDLVVKGVVAEPPGSPTADLSQPAKEEPILQLPSIPSVVEEVHPGIFKAQINESNYYIQAIREFGIYGKGVRVIMEITESGIHKFRFPLNVPQGATAEILGSNQILFVKVVDGEEAPVGLIEAPWAIDANGEPVPASQAIAGNDLVITVNTNGATLPVVADPTYMLLLCDASPLDPFYNSETFSTIKPRSSLGTARGYLEGAYCPDFDFIDDHEYFPKLSSFRGRERVVKREGSCEHINLFGFSFNDGWLTRALTTLPDSGLIYNFTIPCKAHSYCLDLEKSTGIGNTKKYPNVSRHFCDMIFYGDMRFDCAERQILGWIVTPWSARCCLLADLTAFITFLYRGAAPPKEAEEKLLFFFPDDIVEAISDVTQLSISKLKSLPERVRIFLNDIRRINIVLTILEGIIRLYIPCSPPSGQVSRVLLNLIGSIPEPEPTPDTLPTPDTEDAQPEPEPTPDSPTPPDADTPSPDFSEQPDNQQEPDSPTPPDSSQEPEPTPTPDSQPTPDSSQEPEPVPEPEPTPDSPTPPDSSQEPGPTPECIGDQTFDSATNTCVDPECMGGQVVDGVCVCRGAQIVSNGVCVDPVFDFDCRGGRVIDGVCVCRGAQIVDGNRCVDSPGRGRDYDTGRGGDPGRGGGGGRG